MSYFKHWYSKLGYVSFKAFSAFGSDFKQAAQAYNAANEAIRSGQLPAEAAAALELKKMQYAEAQDNAYKQLGTTLFNNVVAIMTGKFNLAEGETPHPCYKDANGKPISLWMKLLRHRRRKNDWINVGQNGELGFDQFIGAGVIEIQKPNTPPAILRVDLSKESITPKETNKQPTIGAPGMGMGGVMTGVPSDIGVMPQNSAFAAAGAGEEMPF